MRIPSQKVDASVQRMPSIIQTNEIISENTVGKHLKKENKVISNTEFTSKEDTKNLTKEKVQQAVASINEFIAPLQTNSKFVYHEGLDEYYVKVVDSSTEEVIKEIPPERLLNAFYEMQKLAGMIVDEKI